MNFRLTAFLFGAIFVLGLGLLVLSFMGDDGAAGDILMEELVATEPDQIDTLEIERQISSGTDTLKLQRNPETEEWRIVEPYDAPADSVAVDQLVAALLKAKPVAYRGITNNRTLYELDPPALRVTLRHGERSSTINCGLVEPGGGGVVFVTTSSRPDRPLATEREGLEPLFRDPTGSGSASDIVKWAGDFREKSVFPVGPSDAEFRVLTISLNADGKTVSLGPSPTGGWEFTNPTGWGAADAQGDPTPTPGTFTGVGQLLKAITSLRATDATDFQDGLSPQELEKRGLTPQNRVTVDLVLKGGNKTTVYIGNQFSPTANNGATPPAVGKWWVQIPGQSGVIHAMGGDLSGLRAVIADPDPLRDRNLLPSTYDANRIDGFDLANGSTKLRKVGNPTTEWRLYGQPDYGDPKAASPSEVAKIVNVLTRRRTVRSFPTGNDANFGEGSVTVKIWADGFNNPVANAEPKQTGIPVELTFGKAEGDAVHVRRKLPNGTTTYFLVPQEFELSAGGAKTAYIAVANTPRTGVLSTTVQDFNSTIADKLTVAGSDVNYQVELDKSVSSRGERVWRFAADGTGPGGIKYTKGDRADTGRVEDLLVKLATIDDATPVRVAAEASTPEELGRFGLGANPRLRVAVGIAKNERVYEFGSPVADKPEEAYLQQPGNKTVFIVRKLLPDQFATADLRNRDLFRLDAAQIAKIEVVGWGAQLGKPGKLLMEKQGDKWVATTAPLPDYAVDPRKVMELLRALDNLKVVEFTSENDILPKHGLDNDKTLFQVVVMNAAGAHHLYLRIGASDGGNVYALTNRVPGSKPIITVPEAPFTGFQAGPGSFRAAE